MLRSFVKTLFKHGRDNSSTTRQLLDTLKRDIRQDAVDAFDIAKPLIRQYSTLYSECNTFVDFLFKLCDVELKFGEKISSEEEKNLNLEIVNLTNVLETTKRDLDKFVVDKQCLEKELETCLFDNDRLRRETNLTRKDKYSYRFELDEWNPETTDFEEQLKKLNSQLREYKSKNQTLNLNMDKMTAQKEELENKLVSVEDELKSLRTEKRNLNEKIQSQKYTAESSNIENEDLKEKIKTLKNKLDLLNNKYDNYFRTSNEQIKELESRFEKSKSDVGNLRHALDEKIRSLKETSMQNELLKNELDSKSNQLMVYSGQLQRIQSSQMLPTGVSDYETLRENAQLKKESYQWKEFHDYMSQEFEIYVKYLLNAYNTYRMDQFKEAFGPFRENMANIWDRMMYYYRQSVYHPNNVLTNYRQYFNETINPELVRTLQGLNKRAIEYASENEPSEIPIASRNVGSIAIDFPLSETTSLPTFSMQPSLQPHPTTPMPPLPFSHWNIPMQMPPPVFPLPSVPNPEAITFNPNVISEPGAVVSTFGNVTNLNTTLAVSRNDASSAEIKGAVSTSDNPPSLQITARAETTHPASPQTLGATTSERVDAITHPQTIPAEDPSELTVSNVTNESTDENAKSKNLVSNIFSNFLLTQIESETDEFDKSSRIVDSILTMAYGSYDDKTIEIEQALDNFFNKAYSSIVFKTLKNNTPIDKSIKTVMRDLQREMNKCIDRLLSILEEKYSHENKIENYTSIIGESKSKLEELNLIVQTERENSATYVNTLLSILGVLVNTEEKNKLNKIQTEVTSLVTFRNDIREQFNQLNGLFRLTADHEKINEHNLYETIENEIEKQNSFNPNLGPNFNFLEIPPEDSRGRLTYQSKLGIESGERTEHKNSDSEMNRDENSSSLKIEELMDDNYKCNQLNQEIEHLKLELEEKTNAIIKLENELKIQKEDAERWKNNAFDQQKVIDNQNIKEKKLKREKNEIKRNYDECSQKLSDYETLVEKRKIKETSDLKTIEELQHQKSAHESEIVNLKNTLLQSKITIQSHVNNVEESARQIENINKQYQNLKSRCDEKEMDLYNTIEEKVKLEMENSRLKEQINENLSIQQSIPNIMIFNNQTKIEGQLAFEFGFNMLFLHFRFLSEHYREHSNFIHDNLDKNYPEKIKFIEKLQLAPYSINRILTDYVRLDFDLIGGKFLPEYIEKLQNYPMINFLEELEIRLTDFIKYTLNKSLGESERKRKLKFETNAAVREQMKLKLKDIMQIFDKTVPQELGHETDEI
ncbi:hypothetical protein AVEN_242290-1 [Araneus ventricosus]|uniref:Uncharacterized protein n=1 Tax=Araneus ventricosus TaxID=182803 RepID=A0A4Y2VY46_ARAVE|nr:hypothetical protein AVEN_242290-1 [Araneus ventricosus]